MNDKILKGFDVGLVITLILIDPETVFDTITYDIV